MTLKLPDGLLDQYNEVCDFFINNDFIGRTCSLVYPPKKEVCSNCTLKPVGASSTNVYRHGGPMPFQFGDCPLCGGNGYKETEITESIRLRIYWSRADWIRIGGSVNITDAEILIIGFMTDLPKLLRATEIRLVKDQNESIYRATLVGQPTPHGFGRNRYFMAFLKGA